jgi:iron complex transport system substrate-binding protein
MAPPARASRPLRVASLLPSATEIVCAVGMEEALVGVSHECDFPPSVAGRPVLTSTRVGKGLPSGSIDRDVRRILREALAVYDIDVEALARAAPDVIVTQDLCDVCAVSLEDVKAAARRIGGPGVEIVNLHPTQLADIWNDIGKVGAALGREREAGEVVVKLRARVEAVRDRATRLRSRPSVLTIEWLDPVMVGGTWMPELVEIAGGRPLVTRPGDLAPTLGLEDLARLAPDVVVVKPCGYRLDRTRAESGAFLDQVGPLGWPAVREGRFWLADGNAYFNRPGPRIADSLEILAACLHPAEFADLAARHASAFLRLHLTP